MTYDNKKVIVSVIFYSPSQKIVKLTFFLSNLEKHLSDISKRKPYLSVITGDVNARYSPWWPKDINTTEGSNLFSNGLPQLINK